MPITKGPDKLIPKLYRRKYDDLGLYFFTEGQRTIMPAITLTKAIENYYRYIGEDDFDIQCAMTVIGKMKHEFFDTQKK